MRWNNIDEIAARLEEEYAEEDIPVDSLIDLKEMVLSLSDFEDHEVDVEDSILKTIIEQWLDLRGK